MEQEEEETKQQGKEEKEEEEEEKEEEAKQDKDIKQEDEEEVEDTKEDVPLEEDEREEKSDGDSPKTPFPKQTPSKLLSQFNKSNNLTMDSPQSLFKTPADIPSDSQQPPDTLQVRGSEERRTGVAKDGRSEVTTVYYYSTLTSNLPLVASLLASPSS